MQPQPAHQEPVAIPGFTAEQNASFQAMLAMISVSMEESMREFEASFKTVLNEALDKRFGPLQQHQLTQQATQVTQQPIPPAPQAKKEEVKETRPQPMYQATVEDAEDNSESTQRGNSIATDSKSHDSKQLFRKWAPHTGFLTTFLATPITSSFGCSLSSSFGCFLASFSASHVGYIRCTEGMEATGEG